MVLGAHSLDIEAIHDLPFMGRIKVLGCKRGPETLPEAVKGIGRVESLGALLHTPARKGIFLRPVLGLLFGENHERKTTY